MSLPARCRGRDDPTPHSRANAYAERFALAAQTEGPDTGLRDRHLRSVLASRGPLKRMPALSQPPTPAVSARAPYRRPSQETIKRQPILGGLMNEYERAA